MDLQWINDNVDRSLGEDGQKVERINNSQYQIKDSQGTVLGTARLYENHAEVNMMNIRGFNGFNEGIAKLREIFGIAQ